MPLLLRPTWDREGTVALVLDTERGALTVRAADRTSRYQLEASDPERLGWQCVEEDTIERDVTVGEVFVACLREWDAEQGVVDLSLDAAEAAHRRGGQWVEGARRLRCQTHAARRAERVSPLPLRTVFVQRRERDELTVSLAAERIGYVADGRADTSRLRRRLGLGGEESRAISYETAVALCAALSVDPMEVGL